MRLVATLITSLLLLSLSTRAVAENQGREFLMSCTYGVLAGTLVGVASLAFVDKPGENLNRVARDASLGLYAGILLGFYVVYIVPALDTPDEEKDPVAAFMDRRFDVTPTMSP